MYKRRPIIRVIILLLICIFASGGIVPANTNGKNYVIILSVDGLRPDALTRAHTPNIDSLTSRSSYTWEATTILPSITLPAHVSMLTGMTPSRHGITGNYKDSPNQKLNTETVFEIAHRVGCKTAMIVGKDKLKLMSNPNTVDIYSYPGYHADQIADKAWWTIVENTPELLFVHLPDPDSTGHKYGWMSSEQIKAIGKVDKAVGKILNAVWLAGVEEETTIILTSDHGGHGKVHGTDDPRDTTIPWVIYGPGIRANYRLQTAVRVYDTAPTALFALNIPIPPNWDGKVIIEAYQGESVPTAALQVCNEQG